MEFDGFSSSDEDTIDQQPDPPDLPEENETLKTRGMLIESGLVPC